MLDQSHNIHQAAEIVVGTVGTPQERLAKGFKAFRRATIISNDWPVELWEKYNCICDTLLAGGTWQKTINRMDLHTANQCAMHVSTAMKDLAIAVQFVRSHPLKPPPATTPMPPLDLPRSSERTLCHPEMRGSA